MGRMVGAACRAILVAAASSLVAVQAGFADWRDEIDLLRVGVFAPTGAAYDATRLEPFRLYLQDRARVPVALVTFDSYDALIAAHEAADIDYGINTATSFATAAVSCGCVEAIAAPVAADGALGFHSILVASADSDIASLADARGKSLALTGADSVAGRLVPMAAFAEEGIAPRQYFTRIATVEDPRAAITAVLSGDVDVGVGWSSLTGPSATGYDFGVLSRMVAADELDMARIRVIWKSPLIPFGPHVVRSTLPPELKQLLGQALTLMAQTNPQALDAVDRLGFGGGGFTTPDASLYSVVIDLVTPEEASGQ
ncbi:phosphate/phosphite/phosphonate ABC transporter substrate-binding protein [Bauldia sp.]|uniref:phosphate/phosphite/phosphonate ABC transporter substrate-binding protein n=1 Tax=Bauldia sp. TaxID=2575872 RepID=UPI003BAABD0E